jgi:hypothetical protein
MAGAGFAGEKAWDVSMKNEPMTLGIDLTGPEADAEDVAEATIQLRRELLALIFHRG